MGENDISYLEYGDRDFNDTEISVYDDSSDDNQ